MPKSQKKNSSNTAIDCTAMRWLVPCDAPGGIEKRFYYGAHVNHAKRCLDAGHEDNAASWMWRDWAELDEGFSPVAGTLEPTMRHGISGIAYIDARDVAEHEKHIAGGGI